MTDTPTITTLASARRWKLSREPYDGSVLGDPIVRGQRGHLWDNRPGQCGVTIMATTLIWNSARKQGLAAGFTVSQNGTDEGAMLFDATNQEHVKLAGRLAGVRARRQLAPDHLAALTRAGSQTRFQPALDGVSGPQNRSKAFEAPSGQGASRRARKAVP